MRLKSLHNITVGVRFTLTRVYVITIIINPALLSFRSSVLFHTLSYHSCRVYGFTLRRRCVGIKGFGPLNMVSIFAYLHLFPAMLLEQTLCSTDSRQRVTWVLSQLLPLEHPKGESP